MADYPTGLPDAQVDGYSFEPMDQSVRTDMEFGTPRKRRRTSARNDIFSVRWKYSNSEMNTFRAWFENDSTGAAGGAGWFNISLNVGNGSVESVEARFLTTFKARLVTHNLWEVQAQIEIRE